MPTNSSRGSRFFEYVLIILVAYVLTQVVARTFFPAKPVSSNAAPIELQGTPNAVRRGINPTVTVVNHLDRDLTLPSQCPMPPFQVSLVKFASTGSGETLQPLTTRETAVPCTPPAVVPANGQLALNLGAWKYSLFGQDGVYEVRLAYPKQTAGSGALHTGTGTQVASVRLSLYEPGVWVKLFRTFITKPFLNFLVFVAALSPSHSLGIGIILLTLLVKLLLFYPTQKSMEGQKKMQMLQPKLEAVRKQYADNPTKMQEETVRLWKEHGVNPVQSCLPILLQFPILIGLFYVIRDGSSLALSQHLIYPMYAHIGWDFNPYFLGIDLTKPHLIFPPLLVFLQYLQMKLSFQIARRKKAKDAQPSEPDKDKAQQTQETVMTYVLPLMIGFFALKFPAAVSLYWGVSTLFAIGQQMIVNREHLKV